MALILILGPMKSGKSYELISYFAPLKYTNQKFALYQSSRNVRDRQIWARDGVEIAAQKVASLAEALDHNFSVIGIDETHMFDEDQAEIIEKLLKQGTKVIASALDTDFKGELFPIVKRLLELGPTEARYRRAACDDCKSPEAIYTQVLKNGIPITQGSSPSVPDDGTHTYKAVCRNCFVRKT